MTPSPRDLFATNPNVAERYRKLAEVVEDCVCTYVWIDGSGENLRCKQRTMAKKPKSVEELPVWNFDGSSTGQASGVTNSDVLLKPVAIYRDPFRLGNCLLVMCETLTSEGLPHATNYRHKCAEVMQRVEAEKPWFGMEQEYTMLDADGHIFGWPKQGFPGPQGPYYCGVGPQKVFARDVVEAHYSACLYAGIQISGTNAEAMPGQTQFSVGISSGPVSWNPDGRSIVDVAVHPAPRGGGLWHLGHSRPEAYFRRLERCRLGCHTNFSTEAMRNDGGYAVIEEAIQRLAANHRAHIAYYDPKEGRDNERRLTGKHETASIDQFNHGVASRAVSVRIPAQTHIDQKGYFEDRRPSSNCDPYAVTGAIVRTCLLRERRLSLCYGDDEMRNSCSSNSSS
ncbi:hypothetical protein L596_013544 [Steinernema carpocapsae]|uniref:glutamine synthetase n=1 Tax=Steinernema carpocapsae TaxID=34508 RepID=A0A4U5P1C8_STECR|nr:hypothetical protein L596_013544 [Steinernema carpocapsae]